jgi:protein XagA
VILGMESFADAEAAYRFYAGNQPAEWRIDLAMGVRPVPRLLMMLQSFNSITNGSGKFGHVSWSKLQPSFVYDIAQQWSVQLGGGHQCRAGAGTNGRGLVQILTVGS